MMRWWVTWGTGLTALFGLLIGWTHLIPGETVDPAMLTVLFDENCQIPCVMGIQPDVTPVNTALTHLRSHDWVDRVQANWNLDRFAREVVLEWAWNGTQPTFINERLPGTLFGRTESDTAPYPVVWITVPTTYRLYDLQVALGQATSSRATYHRDSNQVEFLVNYRATDSLPEMTLTAQIPCPSRLMDYWHSRASISFSTGRRLGSVRLPQSLAQLCP